MQKLRNKMRTVSNHKYAMVIMQYLLRKKLLKIHKNSKCHTEKIKKCCKNYATDIQLLHKITRELRKVA